MAFWKMLNYFLRMAQILNKATRMVWDRWTLLQIEAMMK
jgi:hypothetical protein